MTVYLKQDYNYVDNPINATLFSFHACLEENTFLQTASCFYLWYLANNFNATVLNIL